MDTSGWISISLIASFNRIKNLTNDISIVVECMRMTPLLEVSPKDRFVRLAQTWPQWVLPNAQTNDEVKHDFEEAAKPAAAAPEQVHEDKLAEEKDVGSAAKTAEEATKADAPTSSAATEAVESAPPASEAAPETKEQEDDVEEPASSTSESAEAAHKGSPAGRRGSPPGTL